MVTEQQMAGLLVEWMWEGRSYSSTREDLIYLHKHFPDCRVWVRPCDGGAQVANVDPRVATPDRLVSIRGTDGQGPNDDGPGAMAIEAAELAPGCGVDWVSYTTLGEWVLDAIQYGLIDRLD